MDKIEQNIYKDGTTKVVNRFPNLHDWTISQENAEYPDSGILIPSGFSSSGVGVPNDTTKYILITSSGNQSQNVTNDALLIYPSGSNASDNAISDQLSNASQSRTDAQNKGLYQSTVFNPYIHYGDGRKIDYTDNFKKASKYLDPYSDAYIFQTSLSSGIFQESTPATSGT